MIWLRSLIPYILLSKKLDFKHISATSNLRISVSFSLSSFGNSLLYKLSMLLIRDSIFSLLTSLKLFSGASLSLFLHAVTNLGMYSETKSLWYIKIGVAIQCIKFAIIVRSNSLPSSMGLFSRISRIASYPFSDPKRFIKCKNRLDVHFLILGTA